MHALKTPINIAWIIFGVYWLASAFGAKVGRGSRRRIPLNGLTALSVVLVVRVFRGGSLAVHSPVLGAIGAVVFASGIALAIWARVHLGRNWGMPMTQKAVTHAPGALRGRGWQCPQSICALARSAAPRPSHVYEPVTTDRVAGV